MFGDLLGFAGSLLGGLFGKSNADKQMEMQQQFAQQGVTWKAADARRAERQYGINPLVSMGANTLSYSPVSVGDVSEAMGNAGQSLGRAANALTDKPTRLDQLNEKLIEAKIANVNSDTVRNQAAASSMVRSVAGTPGLRVPIPRDDPRPPLMMKAWRDMHGDTVWLPRGEAASGLQTSGAMPVNAALAAGYLTGGGTQSGEFIPSQSGVRGDVWRNAKEWPWWVSGGTR